ncbi:hypothetical protein E4U51_005645, partial [Claviceps purpurea]
MPPAENMWYAVEWLVPFNGAQQPEIPVRDDDLRLCDALGFKSSPIAVITHVKSVAVSPLMKQEAKLNVFFIEVTPQALNNGILKRLV